MLVTDTKLMAVRHRVVMPLAPILKLQPGVQSEAW